MSTPSDQPVTLTYLVYNTSGALADATAVTIDVLNPDGTVTSGSLAGGQIVHASTGTYTYTTTPTNTGTTVNSYLVHWTSTNPSSAGDGAFKVTPKYHQQVNVTVSDLSTYLNNASLNTTRAQQVLDLAVQLCESIVDPLPAGAEPVVLDVAERGYANPTDVRGADLGLYSEGVGAFSTSTPGTVGGGLWLTENNKQTLRRLAGKGGAFTIDALAASFSPSGQPWWDSGVYYPTSDFDTPP